MTSASLRAPLWHIDEPVRREDIAALWMGIARARMANHDQAGAARAVRAAVALEWRKPDWRTRGR